MIEAKITAFGTNVPNKRIDNDFYEKLIDTTDEWIVSRTGIKTRYHTTDTEFTSDLCEAAIKDMLSRYPVTLEAVDMIIVATVTPDQPMPAMSCVMQLKFNIPHTGAIDIFAACAGFAYGLTLAKGLIAAGTHKKVIVLAAETLSKITDFEDRTSCILFGDGAGVVIVEAAQNGEKGNIGACLTGSYGEGGPDLYMSGLAPNLYGTEIKRNRKIVQNGKKVFKWAINTVSKEIPRLLAMDGLTIDDIDWFVPHSANMRILEGISSELKVPMSKFLESITNFGNTSSASIPLALNQALKSNIVKKGDKMVFFGFGGGLTYAGNVVTWGLD